MLRLLGRLAAVAAIGLAATSALGAEPQAETTLEGATAPAIGGLSLVPDRWRYRPLRNPVVVIPDGAEPTFASPPPPGIHTLRSLDNDYVADRASFINTLRARRGLSLLTLWEGAGRCLFFGINERGRAGINFVRMRTLRDTSVAENPLYARYAELTGQVRPTFPEPPRLFPH